MIICYGAIFCAAVVKKPPRILVVVAAAAVVAAVILPKIAPNYAYAHNSFYGKIGSARHLTKKKLKAKKISAILIGYVSTVL